MNSGDVRGGPPAVQVLVAGAAAVLALALVISSGTLDPYALVLVSLAALAAFTAAGINLRSPPGERSRLAVAALGAGIAGSLVLNLLFLPGITVNPARLGAFRPGVALAALVLASYLWRGAPAWVVRARFPVLLLLGAGLGAVVMRASPAPGIDVWQIQQHGAAGLLAGYNPYRLRYPNVYGSGTPFLDPSLVSADGRFILAYPYAPATLLLDVPSAWLGDVRWTMLAAVVAAAWLVRRLGRGSVEAELAGALLLLQPQTFLVLELSWTEPIALATTLLAVAAVDRAAGGGAAEAKGAAAWLWPGLAGALAAASKQYLPLLLLPLLFALPARARLRAAAVAIVGALAIYLPFLVLDPAALFRGVVLFQVRQPFRPDALSWTAALVSAGGPLLPSWPAFLLSGAVLILSLRRAVSTAQAVIAGATAWTFLVLFSKQAFCNYYWLSVGLLCAAAALLLRPAPAAEGAPAPRR